MPDRRPWDNDEEDDRPRRPRRRDDDDEDDHPRNRRRRDDEEDDHPRSRRRDDDDDYYDEPRPRKKKGSRLLLILLLVAVLPFVLCCGGIGLYMWLGPKPVTILDASRTPSAEGGTASVTFNVRFSATRPGGTVHGDYNFMFKAGNRTSVHSYSLRGDAGAEYKRTFITPELAKEPGPVEFWVERDERGSVSRVSEVRTIP